MRKASRAVISVVSSLIALSCKVPDPFTENQLNPSFNWLSNFGLGVVAEDPANGWSMAYRGKTGDDFEYMALDDTGTTVGTTDAVDGLSPSEAVYRLSIANLFPNGALEDDLSAWAETVGAPRADRWGAGTVSFTAIPDIFIVADGHSIHGQSFYFIRNTPSQFVSLLLSDGLLNAAGSGIGPAASSGYQVCMLFKTFDGTLNARYEFGSAPPALESSKAFPISTTGEMSFSSNLFTDPETDYHLYFGSDGTQRASVDDIRVVRKGVDLNIVLPVKNAMGLELDPEGGFVPGRYEFSVWVHDDQTAGELLTEGLSPEGLIRARAVTLEFRAEGNSTGGGSKVFKRPSDGWPTWTKLSLGLLDMTFDPFSAESIFSLRISPCDGSDPKALEPGSILLAAPALTFHYRD